MRTVLKALLVAATVVCLLSIGGAMMLAFPVLVLLHWLASRGSGPYGTGGWRSWRSPSCSRARGC